MTTALLVIDVQHALCTGRWAAFDIDQVIARINKLSEGARAAKLPVVLVQHEEEDGPLAHGSEGWQLDARLQQDDSDLRIRKRTPNSFHGTDLHGLLQGRGVSRLVVCGLQSEFCVDTTVRQALPLGYDVVLVADAHSTMDTEALSAAQISAHHNEARRWRCCRLMLSSLMPEDLGLDQRA
jgi:nicotinamidase-related amidase